MLEFGEAVGEVSPEPRFHDGTVMGPDGDLGEEAPLTWARKPRRYSWLATIVESSMPTLAAGALSNRQERK